MVVKISQLYLKFQLKSIKICHVANRLKCLIENQEIEKTHLQNRQVSRKTILMSAPEAKCFGRQSVSYCKRNTYIYYAENTNAYSENDYWYFFIHYIITHKISYHIYNSVNCVFHFHIFIIGLHKIIKHYSMNRKEKRHCYYCEKYKRIKSSVICSAVKEKQQRQAHCYYRSRHKIHKNYIFQSLYK